MSYSEYPPYGDQPSTSATLKPFGFPAAGGRAPSLTEQIAGLALRMTYGELTDLADTLSRMAAGRADPKEDLGGFDIDDRICWSELLHDWAESVHNLALDGPGIPKEGAAKAG